MEYSSGFLNNVSHFEGKVPRTEIGLKQFYDFESHGIMPMNPDEYFLDLWNGKAWWEWTLNFIAATYLTNEWVGWYCYAHDFKDDISGFKQLRQRCHCRTRPPSDFLKLDSLSGQERLDYFRSLD